MNKKEIFPILGIEETKDISIIKQAYRHKLIGVNPEDDPKGFKTLREAYEGALQWAEMKEDTDDEKIQTPIDEWVASAATLYSKLSTRINKEAWLKLFSEEICQALDTADEVMEAFLVFLMENYRLPSEIWVLIEKQFGILENSEALYEEFPSNFVDFIMYQIKTPSWLDYALFEGEDDADYDQFINGYFDLKRMNDDNDYSEYEETMNSLEKIQIWHPYFELEKMRYALAQEDMDTAIVGAEKLQQGYADDLYISYYLSSVNWASGDYEGAYTICKNILEKQPDHFSAIKRISEYHFKNGNYEAAKEGYLDLIERYPSDEVLLKSLEEVNACLIESYEAKIKQEPDNKQFKLDLGWCLFQNTDLEGCIETVENLEVDATIFYEYHNLVGRAYWAMEAYEKAYPYLLKWQEAILKTEEDGSEASRKIINRLPLAYYALADCHFQFALAAKDEEEKEREFDKAIPYFDQAIMLEKACEDKLTYRSKKAYALLKLEKNESCVKACDEIIDQNSDYFPAYVYRQEAYFNLKQGQGVIDDFYNAIEIFKGYPKNYILAAKVFYIYEQYDDALGVIKRADEAEIISQELKFQELKIKRVMAETKEEIENIDAELATLFEEVQQDLGDLEDVSGVLYERAICQIRLKNNKEALVLNEKSQKIKCNDNTYKQKGDIYYNLDDYEKALEVYQELFSKFPEYDTVIYDIGDCYMALGNIDKAIEHYKKVLEVNPEHNFVNNKLMEIYQKKYSYAYEEEDYKMAVTYAKQQVKVSPTNYYYNELGLMYLDGYELEKAKEAFKSALEVEDTNPYSYNNLGFVYKIMGNYEKAYENYALAIKNKDDDYLTPHWNMAAYYMITKQYEKAVETYQYLMQQLPESLEALEKLADAYEKMGEWSNARVQYEKAMTIEDDDKKWHYLEDIGNTYAFEGNQALAMTYYKKAIKKCPKDSGPYSSLASYWQYMLGDKKKALRYYKKAYKIAKNYDTEQYEERLQDLMDIFKDLGKEKDGIVYFKEMLAYLEKEYGSIKTYLKDPAYHKVRLYILGTMHFSIGNYEQVRYYLEEMKKASNCRTCKSQTCFECSLLEGMMFEQDADYASALEQYKNALETCPVDMRHIYKVKEMFKKVSENR
ncbi:MAG: tetratricopeptide repeat protein [Cellulosilyticaceae bacterium]